MNKALGFCCLLLLSALLVVSAQPPPQPTPEDRLRLGGLPVGCSDGNTAVFQAATNTWVCGTGGGGPVTPPDATNTVKGILKLTNHLGGSADLPTVINGDLPAAAITSGTLQLIRGGTSQTAWTASRCVQVNAGGTALESAAGACGTSSLEDNITVNGVALVDADFDDATPAAPADSLNVAWQKDGGSPANVSANILMTAITKLGTIVTGVWNGTAITDAFLASNYSGVGSCSAGSAVTATVDNAAPTCTATAAFTDEASTFTAEQIISGVELDFEAGGSEGWPRLAQSTAAVGGDCDAAAEAGRLYFDSDADTDGSVFVCTGSAWKDIDDDGGAGGSSVTRIAGSSGAAGADITWQNLTANASTITSTTPAVVMTTTGVGAGTWMFDYVIIYQTAATTTGIGLSVNHTGTTGTFASQRVFQQTASTSGTADQATTDNGGEDIGGKGERVKNTVSSSSAGVDTANSNVMERLYGMVVVTVSGSLELKVNTEVAASGVTVQADSLLMLYKIE